MLVGRLSSDEALAVITIWPTSALRYAVSCGEPLVRPESLRWPGTRRNAAARGFSTNGTLIDDRMALFKSSGTSPMRASASTAWRPFTTGSPVSRRVPPIAEASAAAAMRA
jgi:hypothetical protein